MKRINFHCVNCGYKINLGENKWETIPLNDEIRTQVSCDKCNMSYILIIRFNGDDNVIEVTWL